MWTRKCLIDQLQRPGRQRRKHRQIEDLRRGSTKALPLILTLLGSKFLNDLNVVGPFAEAWIICDPID